jgi:hypothetical protein
LNDDLETCHKILKEIVLDGKYRFDVEEAFLRIFRNYGFTDDDISKSKEFAKKHLHYEQSERLDKVLLKYCELLLKHPEESHNSIQSEPAWRANILKIQVEN